MSLIVRNAPEKEAARLGDFPCMPRRSARARAALPLKSVHGQADGPREHGGAAPTRAFSAYRNVLQFWTERLLIALPQGHAL